MRKPDSSQDGEPGWRMHKKMQARQSSRSTQELGVHPAKPNSHAAPAYLKPAHFEAPMSPPQLRIRMWSGFALRDRCRLDTNTKLAHELHPQASVRKRILANELILGQNFNGVNVVVRRRRVPADVLCGDESTTPNGTRSTAIGNQREGMEHQRPTCGLLQSITGRSTA